MPYEIAPRIVTHEKRVCAWCYSSFKEGKGQKCDCLAKKVLFCSLRCIKEHQSFDHGLRCCVCKVLAQRMTGKKLNAFLNRNPGYSLFCSEKCRDRNEEREQRAQLVAERVEISRRIKSEAAASSSDSSPLTLSSSLPSKESEESPEEMRVIPLAFESEAAVVTSQPVVQRPIPFQAASASLDAASTIFTLPGAVMPPF